jgi:hypothetical protein
MRFGWIQFNWNYFEAMYSAISSAFKLRDSGAAIKNVTPVGRDLVWGFC